jgi:uncharacterized membrane protein
MERALFLLTLAAALGSALIAGTFFGFSAFVMQALARIPSAQGIAAMQSINIVVINPLFLGIFMGTAVVCAILTLAAIMGAPGSFYLLVGSALYVVGCFGVTMLFNVPRNNALAALSPASPEAAVYWAEYVKSWTAWNHARTVASLAACAAFIAALVIQRLQALGL